MAWVMSTTKPSMFGMRKQRKAMRVMNVICRYIRRLGIPCLLEFCSTFGKKPERPAWPSMNEGPAMLVTSDAMEAPRPTHTKAT